MDVNPAVLMAVGLAAGLAGGLLGIGGSVVMIPAMTLLFGVHQHLYQGAAMIVNFFVVAPAVYKHARAQAILPAIVRWTIPLAVAGVLGGVWLSKGWWFQGAQEIWLARLFGAFLFYVAGYNIYRLFKTRSMPDLDSAAARRLPGWRTALFVGLPTGLVGGLLGIGGGSVAVPLQQLLLRVPLRRAIANSATTILPLSLVGAIYKNVSNAQAGMAFADALRLAVCLIPTAIVGGYVGAHLTHVIPRRLLRGAFIVLMLYGGYSLVTRARADHSSRQALRQGGAPAHVNHPCPRIARIASPHPARDLPRQFRST